jgi:hypothetical protein
MALQFLAVLGLMRVGFELAYDCLVAAGRRRELIVVQALWLVALVPALVVLSRYRGIAGAGAGHVLVAGLLVAPAFLVALWRAGISLRAVALAVAEPLLWGALSAAAAELVRRALGDGFLGLCAAGTAALVVYSPMLLRLRLILRGSRRTSTVAPGPVPAPATLGGE